MGVPQNGWFVRENPVKMDDLGLPKMIISVDHGIFWSFLDSNGSRKAARTLVE